MSSGGSNGFMPLNDSAVDFSNQTQAFNFLQEILDDSYLQIESKRYARYFWYGIVVVIVVATTCNLLWKAILHARLVLPSLLRRLINLANIQADLLLLQ